MLAVQALSQLNTKHIFEELLDKDPQLSSEDIIGELFKEFMGFSISKMQFNHHLRNNMPVTIKKPTFEPEANKMSQTTVKNIY
ncbi:hypothetical protein HPULCUR_004010 [Helicostylum pulchrum]|uniref:Uncharacterized protein n=1 Tax=Helicostylum pulchrum TaxID=562976 RepID=A0ABP9XWA9_9FUNG